MRFAVFSDVHGNLAALDAVLADIARRGVDGTLGLGDFVSGPFDPVGVADRIIGLGVPVVRGNHDRWLHEGRENDWNIDALVRGVISPAHLDWLRSMPLSQVIGGEVFMCHATPGDDNMYWMDMFTDEETVLSAPRDYIESTAAGIDYPVLLCGHTHLQRNLRLQDGRLLVNPGSVGLPFMLGSPDARYAIIERRGGIWSVDMIAVPYDRTAPQQQARALGFPGFATAIETGWAKLSEL
jgi:diadenosine tetraphosphatase ApaH/serine/threonine PP2A family protein phosphatase